MQRRRVLIGGGGVAVAGGLAAAGFASADTVSGDEQTASVTAADASASSTTGVCSLTAEVTEGPYSLAGALVREDIREDKEGNEVQYTFTVVDEANDCAPLADALVEIWHCDALGEYSGFVGANGHSEEDNGTFLRGGQMTDANGQCSITSIWPGHYVSRAVHVHLRVHTDVTLADDSYTGGEIVHTGQLFFDPDIIGRDRYTGVGSSAGTEPGQPLCRTEGLAAPEGRRWSGCWASTWRTGAGTEPARR